MLSVGPSERIEFVLDTLRSVETYIGDADCHTIVIDDSRSTALKPSIAHISGVEIITPPAFVQDESGCRTYGNLTSAIFKGLCHAVSRVGFKVLIKIDVDTLITGGHPEKDLICFFDQNPVAGIVGAYRIRGDGTNKRDAMRAKGSQLLQDLTNSSSPPKDRQFIAFLSELVVKSTGGAYALGDTVTGGGYAVSYDCARRISCFGETNLLSLRQSSTGEDTLMALCAAAAGFELADMPHNENIFAVNWRGYPMEPTLVDGSRTKLFHPVKHGSYEQEVRLRAHFERERKRWLRSDL